MVISFRRYEDSHKPKSQQNLEKLNIKFDELQEISEQEQRRFNLRYSNKKGNASLEDIDSLMSTMGSAGLAATAVKERQEAMANRKEAKIIPFRS